MAVTIGPRGELITDRGMDDEKLLKVFTEAARKAIEDIGVYRRSVALRRGVPEDHVYLENGRVVFDRV